MRDKNKGFTLVEMIVTLVVLSILLSLSVAGLLSWQDWSNFNRENEYAQILYIAAQNQLAEYGADGRLKELQDSLSGGTVDEKTGKKYTTVGLNLTDSVSLLKNGDGEAYSLTGIYPESKDKEAASLYQDEIVSLRAKTGEYENYLKDPEAFKVSNPEAYWVFELLGSYVYDTSILNGSKGSEGSGNGASVCVEITPENGQVFSVLYSDLNDSFIYLNVPGEKEGSAEGEGVADISDRSESFRKERMVGYYGVDTLYTATKNQMISPSLSSVKLYNRETFYLTCRLSAEYRSVLTSRLTYLIDLDASRNVNDRKLTLKLDGAGLKNAENAQVINCPVSRYDAEGREISLGEFPVLAWVEKDYTIHVVLDAADIQATTDLYERELEEIRSDDKAADTKFAKTLSFFRFGVAADDVYASVTATGEGFAASKTASNFGNLNVFKNQEAKHPVFAGKKTEDVAAGKVFTYSVINPRHLYNIRYMEDLSYEKEAGSAEAAAGIAGVTFLLKSDIDWTQFQQNGDLYNSYDTTGNIRLSSLNGLLTDPNGVVIDNVTRYNCDFPSISGIRERDMIDGNHKTITGISVSEISNVLYGVYLSEHAGAFVMDDNRPTGFVNVNYGTIRNLKLDAVTASGSDCVGGFCGINAGTADCLETVNSKGDSLIAGRKHVGGIIGCQLPAQSDFVMGNLVNRAKVQGVEAVGGILGMIRNEFASVGVDLTELTGLSATARQLLADPADLTIRIHDCENYGEIAGVNASKLREIYTGTSESGVTGGNLTAGGRAGEDSPEEPRYIGGIVGYCYNRDETDTEKITIEKCTSAPQFDSETLTSILADDTKLNSRLKGVYVGGIAGYNYYGQINQCSTQAPSGKEGYIFGYRYVGGILGFNIGPASGIVGSYTTRQGENTNHVIAYEYAGGITGCNAGVRDTDSEGNDISMSGAVDPEKLTGLLLPDSERNLHVKIDNWVNKGIVIAVNAYSGGITGYNAGFIYRCNSTVKAATADNCFKTLYSGNYAGGIAGYNNGVIGNTERTISADGKNSTVVRTGERFSTVSYVKGHHYVGGIVGYNDVDSVVENYEIASGYVLGDEGSCFVGGYAGLNASVDLLMNMSSENYEARFIHSNPNRVEGSCFVGGNIGGNLINMADNAGVDRIDGVFLTDNFLGILEGKAFVGGFVGYNLLFYNPEDSDWIKNDPESYRGGVYILQRQLIDAFEKSDASSLHAEEKLIAKKEILDDLSGKLKLNIAPSEKGVLISGRGADSTKVSFGTISGALYVGGVMGYNDENTKLYISNVENATPIEGTSSIPYKEEQLLSENKKTGAKTYRETDYNGYSMTYRYSYAGGIIGKVSQKMTLDNCWNASTGTVKTAGTYTGGLCEINEGTVKNCTLPNFGSSVQDYVGGLCGLNKGVIADCTFGKKTVSGRNVVGGIAAENFGTIRNIKMENAKLLVEGRKNQSGEKDGVAGLITAYNGNGGKIELSTDIINVSVTSGGSYAGIAAGINEGNVKNRKAGLSSDMTANLTLSGSVKGDRTVGGLIGLNKDPDTSGIVEYYTNRAQITAVNGNAGGIIGENLSGNTIRYCINDAVVSASDSGNAGGITSSNNSLIADCIDYRTVTAPEGMCGGIVALNKENGVIRGCQVKPSEGQTTLTFRSNKTAGGVAAQNDGEISGNFLENIIITNETAVLGTNMGVIAGENRESGRILFADSSLHKDGIANCSVIVQSNYCKAGGVAGTNAGEITGTADAAGKAASLVNSSLSMDNATLASLGGVAGSNTGSITNMAVDGVIQGKLGAPSTGYGGVAGFSGFADKGAVTTQVSITNCSFDGVINAEGSSGAPVRIGGIAGVNGYGSVVEACGIGVRSTNIEGDVTPEAGITYITAGDYEHKTADSVSTTDTKSYSYLGGIAGDNYGKVLACDNQKHSTDTVKVIGFAGETGGIVGYNYEYGIVTGYLDEDGVTEHYLTTGKTWSVEQRCCGNDRGPGGIIGKSVSSEALSYVINYAPVTCVYKSNNYVGGLIGVLGQQYDLKTEFYKCENYGDIKSYRSAGGLVGMLESNGADFTECTNWGKVHADTNYAGGLLALHYSYSVGTNFTHCANHGMISHNDNGGSGYVGGFVGREYSSVGTVESYLYDCVNTGIIRKGQAGSAFQNTGAFFGSSSSRVIMELCRNYNTGTSENGFIGAGSDIRLKNCLDDSGITTRNSDVTPFGGGYGWNTNLFYLDAGSENTFSHKDYGIYFSFHEGPNGDFQLNGLRYRDTLKDPSYLFCEPGISNRLLLYRNDRYDVKQLNLNLDYKDASEGIDSLVVYFWNGSEKKDSAPNYTYSCKATYYYSDGSSLTTEKQSAMGYYDLTEESRVILKNPSADKKPVQVRLAFDNTNSTLYLRGINYIPAAESGTGREAVCTYLGEKYDTTFSIEDIVRNRPSGTVTANNGFSTTLPTDVWYCYSNDVMDINWTPYTNYRLQYDTGDSADIVFRVDNGTDASGMDAFVFYLANDNTNSATAANKINTFYYEYSVTFTDKNGNTVTTEKVTDAAGYDSGEENYRERSRQVVAVPAELDSEITSITLHIKNTKSTQTADNGVVKVNNNSRYIYFRGFSWIPKGETGEQRMAAGTGNSYKSFYDRSRDKNNKNIRLKVDYSGGTPYVYLPFHYDTGFSMTYASNDPISSRYYADWEEYETSVTAGESSGSRIDTYLDIDPKFTEFTEDVCTVYRKLTPPGSLTRTEENSCLKYTWTEVMDAYGYEVCYEVVNGAGDIVYVSEPEMTGSLQINYTIPIENSWRENGCRINFRVRALNAYHYDHDDEKADDYDQNYEKYDSDWTCMEDDEVVRMALPKPEVHMEVVAGNRTTFVLDNYEKYVEEGCTDCTIHIYYNGKNYEWNVEEDGKYRKPEAVDGSPSGPTDFRYYAQPNDSLEEIYTTSAIHYQKGEGHGNNTLPNSDRYCNTRFLGFFGTEADNLEYRISFVLNSQDTYLMTDISAYDETVGATVAYDSEVTHAANSYSGGGQLILTSTLKNLPEEWFAADKITKMTARAYPYRSQFDIIHYGHDVAEDIVLDGTVEENRAVLAGIFDDQYFTSDSEIPVSNCIWDAGANDLKSGYVLLKQENGTYNIYYSSVVELSQTAAAEQRKNGDSYREYYKYDVSYRIYNDFAQETDGSLAVNSYDFQESYWSRGIKDDTTDNYNTVRTDSNDRKFVQEVQPTPIVEEAVEAVVDEDGHTVYRFRWDTYYQDTACWHSGNANYSWSDMKHLTDAEGTFATWDAFLSKFEKAGLANTIPSSADSTARINMQKLMCAYYHTYSSASYRVDLIGITADGKEFILDTAMVDSPTELGEMTSKIQPDGTEKNLTTLDGTTNTTYKVWDYECSFTDTNHVWGSYPRLTARITHLGSLQSIKTRDSKPKSDNYGASYLLPRYTDQSIDVKLQMNTISKPEVTLLMENGQFITNDLIYDVKWGAITEERQKKDLGGYLITVKVADAADDARVTKPHYFYVTDVADLQDTIGLDTEALSADGVVGDVTADYIKEDNICRTRISLADFNTDDVVEISVRAIARTHAEEYTDSAEGVTTEITIPNRLKVPDAAKLSGSPAGSPGETIPASMDKASYLQGFTFRYATDDYTDISDAEIAMAAAVFDEKPAGAESDSMMVPDGFDTGARKVLYGKNAPVSLGKANEGNAVTIDLTEYERYPGEYAGKWLKIALQATCETKIDSQWTDQDPDGNTINYIWVQIPAVVLPDVSLTELGSTEAGDVVRYELEGVIYNSSQDEAFETPIATKSLSFGEEKNVSGYSIEITGAVDEGTAVYTLYLQRHLQSQTDENSFDGTWDVYLGADTGITVVQPEEDKPVCGQNPDAVWLGRTGRLFATEEETGNTDDISDLIEIADIHKEFTIAYKVYNMTAQLRYAENGAEGSFILVLPDITVVGETPYEGEEYFTTQVEVKQYLKPEQAYTAGQPALYRRQESETE